LLFSLFYVRSSDVIAIFQMCSKIFTSIKNSSNSQQ